MPSSYAMLRRLLSTSRRQNGYSDQHGYDQRRTPPSETDSPENDPKPDLHCTWKRKGQSEFLIKRTENQIAAEQRQQDLSLSALGTLQQPNKGPRSERSKVQYQESDAGARNEVTKLSERLKEQSRTLHAQEQQIKNLLNEISNQHNETRRLRKQYDDLNVEYVNQSSQLHTYQQQIDQLSQTINQNKAMSATVLSEYDTMKTNYKRSQLLQDKLKTEVGQLKQYLNDKANQLNQQQLSYSNLQNELRSCNELLHQSNQQKQSLQAQLVKQGEESVRQIGELRLQLNTLQNIQLQCDNYKLELDRLEIDNKRLNEQLSREQQTNEQYSAEMKLVGDYMVQLDASSTLIRGQQETIGRQQQANNEQQATIQQLGEQLRHKDDEIAQHLITIDNFKADIQRQNEEISALTEQCKACTEQLSLENASAERQKFSLQQLEAERQRYSEAFIQGQEEINNLKRENASLQSKVELLTRQLASRGSQVLAKWQTADCKPTTSDIVSP